MTMSAAARVAFNSYLSTVAGLSGLTAEAAVQGFTVEPSVEQKLEKKVQESAAFLGKINVLPVTQLKGDKLGMTSTGPLSSRTNTSAGNGRKPKDGTGLVSQGYECVKIDCDTFVKYDKIDTWAKFPNFQQMMRDVVIQQKALDRIMIGFNGTHAADDTDLTAFPLLQDVAIGWLQQIRVTKPDHWLKQGGEPNLIRVGFYADDHVDAASRGKKGDFANLDALVTAAIQLLPAYVRGNPNLVCIVGQDLMNDKFFPLIDVKQAPSEQIAAGQIMSQKKLGGKNVEEAPYFPDSSILITTLDNLSIYYQEGGRRERVQDEPAFNRITTYTSSNDAYVVEDYDWAVLIENISTDSESWPAI